MRDVQQLTQGLGMSGSDPPPVADYLKVALPRKAAGWLPRPLTPERETISTKLGTTSILI